MRTILAALAFAVFAGQATAADGDFRTGTFKGKFCGASATFEVTSRKKGTWRFDGKILIKSTGEYDRLRIEQYSDQSLRIERYLSGPNTGKLQRVDTDPPQFMSNHMYFYSPKGVGTGCGNDGAVTKLSVFY